MASRRQLVSASSTDVLANQEIREVSTPSIVNLWATAVTVTDLIGLALNRTTIMPAGTCNVSAAALGMVDTDRDQLIFGTVVGAGLLRMPWTVTTSGIYLLSVEPIL